MESSKVIVLSLPACCAAMLLGFCHNLSYYFKLRFYEFEDSKVIFLKNIIFYSNFPNFLFFLKSPTLTIVLFYVVQGIVYYFTLYIFLIAILRRYQLNSVLNSKIMTILNFFFQYYVSLFYWVFFVPALELFSNVIDCNWYSYLDDYPQNCGNTPVYVTILSILAMIVTIINGFFILWLYRTYMFLDTGLLKKKFTMILAILYITKFLLVVVYPLIAENISVMVFIFLHIIGIYSLFDYIRNFPITNANLSRFYIAILCSFENCCIIFSFFEYTNLIDQESLFYILMFTTLFSVKVGQKIFEIIYHNMLKSNMDNQQFLGYCLEEFYRLYQSRHICAKDAFFMGGVMKLHIIRCKDDKCYIQEKTLNEFDFMNLDTQQKLMNNFISQTFTKNIKAMNRKNSSNARNFELIVLKFSSFLNKNNSSPMKAYYEIEKIYSLNSHKSFYFQSISMNVLRQIRALIMLYELRSHKNADLNENDKELEVTTFFEMFNEKLFLKRIFLELLEKRMNFWDKYKDGFHSYEEVFKVINTLMNEVVELKERLNLNLTKNKNSQKIIFDLRFKTIFECVVFNNVNNAVKNEDELDKIKKRELTLEKNILNCNSFFSNNYATVHASFLHSHGKILEKSKKESLARFFNYNMEEVKALNDIDNLMPKFLSLNHPKFIRWYLKKDRSMTTKEKKFIPTFGIDKKGFIFPIKLYVGFNFDYLYDVVFHAAMLDLGKREEQILIFDQEGQILGLTTEFYRLFNKEIGSFKVDLMTLMNIYNFVPNLNALLKKAAIFEDVSNSHLINQVCQIYFPQNLEEIFTVFALKLKEEVEEKNNSKSYNKSVISIKSNKESKSIKSSHTNFSSSKKGTNKSKSTRFLNKFLQTWNKTASEKLELEQKFHDKEITNFELLDLLIDRPNCRRHKINFNVHITRHYYSEKDCISYCHLVINRISRDMKDFNNNNNLSVRNKFDTFYDPKSATMATPKPSDLSEKLSDLEMEPFQRVEDDVESNFVIMPEINQPTFKGKGKSKQNRSNSEIIPEDRNEFEEAELQLKKEELEQNNKRLLTEDNRLMTTENDVLPSAILDEKMPQHKKVLYLEDPRKSVNTQDIPIIKEFTSAAKLEERKLNRTPPPESFVNTSEHSGFGKLKNVGLNTSNQKVIDALEHSSQKSSITNVKKTFTVFAIINLIQKNTPSSLTSFLLSQIVQLLIVICYCISVYVLSVQYIQNYYNPLNEAVLDFAKIYNTYSCTNLVTVEYEYAIYNYSNNQNGFTYNTEFKQIIAESFTNLKELTNNERSKPNQFSYQTFFKSVNIMVSDSNLPEMKEISFVEFLDFIIEQLYDLSSTDFSQMTLEKLEYFSINFINFLDIYSKITQSIDSEFFLSNDNISNQLEVILILFFVTVFMLKCFEYCQMEIFYRKIIRILNIFLRVNQKEAFGEFFLTKDIHQVLKDPMDSFLNYGYIDKVLMKREHKMFEIGEEENNRSSPTKKKGTEKKSNFRKKLSFQDLRPLSRIPLLSYVILFGGLVLLYIGLNYYYFVVINNKVKNLIDITIFFEKIYTLPTTVIMLNKLIIRERVITNQLYNFPNTLQREEQLNTIYNGYADQLSTTTQDIALYSLNAINNIANPDFQFIIYGDACQTLVMEALIPQDQQASCEDTINTAFQKGLLNIINEILRDMSNDDVFRVIYNDTASREAEKLQIFERLKNNVGVDYVTADYYLNKLLMVFYNELSNYYQNEMLTQIGYLKIVILVTTIVLGFVLIAVIWYSKKHYEKVYKNISLTLNLIPYEKLLNDEQTLFLIKKYWRE